MVYLYRCVPCLYFCIRVLIYALIASPVMAQSAESPNTEQFPASTNTVSTNAITIPEESLQPPVSLVTDLPVQTIVESDSALPAPVLDQQTPSGYWLVSSRRALQTIHGQSRGPWRLDVLQNQLTGSYRSSNLNDLSAQLVPGIPVCVFSHGSFVKWESHCSQACEAYQKLHWATGNQPLQMIFFSWPSDGPYTHLPQVDVAVRGKRAEFNGFHLATLIAAIPESCPVTLIGHSHGSRVTLSAMHLAAGGSIQGYSFTGSIGSQRRMRVVLAAGAMDHNWLNPGERYGLALNRVECLLNLRNQNDLPLTFYPLHRPFARRPIARSGITIGDTARLGDNAAKVRQVDVTNVVGSDHLWPDYYSKTQVLVTIAPYLISY